MKYEIAFIFMWLQQKMFLLLAASCYYAIQSKRIVSDSIDAGSVTASAIDTSLIALNTIVLVIQHEWLQKKITLTEMSTDTEKKLNF